MQNELNYRVRKFLIERRVENDKETFVIDGTVYRFPAMEENGYTKEALEILEESKKAIDLEGYSHLAEKKLDL